MMQTNKISRENNMTLVRYFLAINVFIGHFNVLNLTEIPRLTGGFTNIGAFFCLSGFFALITYKEGMGLWSFLKKRAKRLIPPYATVVILSAILLFLTSSLSMREYFTSPAFWKYLICNLCYLNFLQPSLPGVFEDNYINAINGSLWYMKVEWLLTLSVPVIVWIKNKLNVKMTTLLISIITLSAVYRFFILLMESQGYIDYEKAYRIMKQFPGELIYFYSGTLLFLKYNQIKSHSLFSLFIFGCLGILSFVIPFQDVFVAPLATSGLVIWFSIIGKWCYRITGKTNFSYGLYLVHFPIIQLFIYWQSIEERIWPEWLSFSCTLVTTWVIAYLIWLVFNKPSVQPANVQPLVK